VWDSRHTHNSLIVTQFDTLWARKAWTHNSEMCLSWSTRKFHAAVTNSYYQIYPKRDYFAWSPSAKLLSSEVLSLSAWRRFKQSTSNTGQYGLCCIRSHWENHHSYLTEGINESVFVMDEHWWAFHWKDVSGCCIWVCNLLLDWGCLIRKGS
jgi:hypothetical protein